MEQMKQMKSRIIWKKINFEMLKTDQNTTGLEWNRSKKIHHSYLTL